MDNPSGQPQRRREFDRWLLYSTFLLVGLGLLMIFSATSQSDSSLGFLKRQAIFVSAGTVLMVTLSRLPYERWRKLSILLILLSTVLVGTTLIPGFGPKIKGATRWIRFAGFSIQPTEFLKVALVMFLAAFVSKRGESIRNIKVLCPAFILVVILCALIIKQPDYGTMLIICAIAWIMLFVGGARLPHVVIPIIVALPIFVILVTSSEYRTNRFEALFNPWATENGSGHQVTRSMMAYGKGHITGKGLSNSELKLKHLPEAHTDFILAVLGEEMGLVGVFGVLILYGTLLWRGFLAGIKSAEPFGSLLAVGLSSVIGIQIVLNVGVTMGVLPPTGLTLPLMSYGGSSLLCTMASIGVVLNIGQRSRHVQK